MTRYGLLLALPLVGCGSGGGFPDAPVPDAAPTATFSVTWSVIDQNSQPLPCGRIAAQSMTVLAHNKEFEGGSTQVFTCDTGMGQSQEVVAGTFDLAFELSGTFGLLARAPTQTDVVIPPGTNTPIEPLVFQVDAIGNLALQLASNATGGNCAGGAGIETFSIAVSRNSDGACVPLTFDISAGATRPAGTYTTSCTAPADYTGGCIDDDQTLTVTSADSDAYTIRVRGKIGAEDCWINNDPIQIPPLNQTLTRSLNLAHQMTPGC